MLHGRVRLRKDNTPKRGGGVWGRGGVALGEKYASMFSHKHSSSGKPWEQRSKQGSPAAANQQLLISLDDFLTRQQGRNGPKGVCWERDGGGGGLGYLPMMTRFTSLRSR